MAAESSGEACFGIPSRYSVVHNSSVLNLPSITGSFLACRRRKPGECRPVGIEDDLSRLLVGPEASKTWRDIERVCDAVSRELRGIQPRRVETEEELAILGKQLREIGNIPQESDSIYTRLEEMRNRIGWRAAQKEKGTFAGGLVESLSELIPIVKQLVGLDSLESPVSISGLTDYCRETKQTIQTVSTDILRLEEFRKRQRDLEEDIKRDQLASQLTEEIKRLINAGVPGRIKNRNKQKSVVATYSDLLAGCNADALEKLLNADPDMTVNIYRETISRNLSDSETSLATTKSEYEDFRKLREQSLNLAQELRQIAARILQDHSESDKCPLCHTQFERGELAMCINADVNKGIEETGQGFLAKLQEQESAVRDATASKRALDSLSAFVERAHLTPDISVRTALAEVNNAKKILANAQGRLEVLNKEILDLESQGLSLLRQEDILGELRKLGYLFAELSQEATDGIVLGIKQHWEKSTGPLKKTEDR